jgi:dipeptidase
MTLMANKKLIVLIILTVAMNIGALACTNFIISRGATADSSTMITYVADSHVLYGELYYRPAADYPEGALFDVYEWDTGKYLGRIKQVRHTFSVVGNMNEHQVAIGETTYTGREELQDTTAIVDYGSLMYITLQRARTARQAIHIMDALVTEYGYYSTGESFSISDPNEVWIMEIIGKGPGNKGAVWVARRIPDGYISGHANQARITTFPQDDTLNCLYSEDVISFAREKGYFEGEDKDFSFADAYCPLNFVGARICDARVWAAFRRVADGMDRYTDYAMGINLDNRLPLWVKPKVKLTVHDVMELMRDYFQDTPMDMSRDFGAGPFGCVVRWRPLFWEIDSVAYFNERATSTQQTGFSFIAQSRSWLPDPIGGIFWFGVDDTYSTVYSPMYCGITRVPEAYAEGNGSIMDFSDEAAFWVFNQVSNFAYTRYSYMIPEIREKQKELETLHIMSSAETDNKAAELLAKDRNLALEYITSFSVETGNSTVTEWKKLYRYLFTKYMDGNIKEKIEGQQNPYLEQPGYSEQWYRLLIRETGDRFRLPEGELH